jgi:uncharacterized membrane protein YqjE
MPTTRMQQRSVPEVLQDIIGNIEEIIRSEFRLAKAEIKDEAAKAAKPGTTLGIGLVLGFYGLGFVLLAAVYALSSVVTTWMAALIVGAGLAVVASALIGAGAKGLKRLDPTTGKTIRTLQENAQWAKDQIK